MFVECMNVEFAPPEEAAGDAYGHPVDRPPEPEATAPPAPPDVRVLSPEEEERVKRQSERFRKAAPVPGFGQPSQEALSEAGFAVRTAGE